MMEHAPPPSHPSLLLLVKTAAILFASELAIMFTLPLMGELNPWLEALLDAVMVTLVAGTLSYYLVLKPLLPVEPEENQASRNDLILFIAKFGMVIFTVESGIMLVLPMVDLHEENLGKLLDALALSLLAAPVLLYWAMGDAQGSATAAGQRHFQKTPLLFLILFLPSMLALALLTMALYHSEVKTQRTLLRAEERNHLENLRREILREIRAVVGDLLILSRQVELLEMLEGEAKARELLVKDHLNFLLIKQDFHQLRLLDLQGRETLVSENTGRTPRLLPEEALQEKKERPFFKEALRMKQGEVYISPMDLKMEGAQVRQPLTPVIRFATPMFDEKGKKQGIMLLSLRAEPLLHRVESSRGNSLGALMVINAQGYWLHGRPAEELWGFQLPERQTATFATLYPDLWPQVQASAIGQVENSQGLFTFREVHPSPSWLRRSIPTQVRGEQPQELPASSDEEDTLDIEVSPRSPLAPVWKLITFIPAEQESQQFRDLSNRLVLLFFVLSSLLALALWNLAKALARRNRAEAELLVYSTRLERHSNELEQMVQERTKQLVHAERLATLGTFSAGMAHEINNPNAFISGNVQFLRKFWELAHPILMQHAHEDKSGRIGIFSDEIGSTLDGILDGSQRISKIVDSLKTYSKGGMEADKVECRLMDPILDAQNLLRHRIKKSPVQLKFNLPGEIMLYCDRQQICQIFVNLFNNALEAIEAAGMEQGEIAVRAQEIDDRAWIWIKDNGPGIPEQAAGKIFDPFYTTKGKTKGTGLGLSIVHGIIQDHRGQITVYSPPEGSTEFLIILPTLALHKARQGEEGGKAGRLRPPQALEKGP